MSNTASNTIFHNRYHLKGELGRGAMGVVYRALDAILDREVAVKTLSLSGPSRDEQGHTIAFDELGQSGRTVRLYPRGGAPVGGGDVQSFLDEARIAAKFNHPAITTIHDVGAEDGIPFVVMELIHGETLEALITNGKDLALAQKFITISSVAKALHYAHNKGVIHRDIKPGNLMIDQSQQTKVMDFGVARVAAQGQEEGRPIIGTPLYMSPEQLQGEIVDGRTDLFSLGVTAFQLLTGKHPFDRPKVQQTMVAIISDDHPKPTDLLPSLPQEVDELLSALLSKSPAERPENARDIADAFDILIDNLATSDPTLRARATAKRETIDYLKANFAFFSDFSAEEIVAIFQLAKKVNFGAGETIFTEGTLGSNFFIVMEGRVQIVSGDGDESVQMRVLKKGSLFGEMAIIDHAPRAASAIAMSDVTLLSISDAVMRHKLPELSLKLYRNLSSAIAEHLRSLSTSYKAFKHFSNRMT